MLRALVLAFAFAFATAAAVPSARAESTPEVVMYATSWCPYCAKARAYFAESGIAYVERDVEKSARARADFKRLGGRAVPFIVVGRESMNGFSEVGFEFLMARAAR
jgi:glutaredoxin